MINFQTMSQSKRVATLNNMCPEDQIALMNEGQWTSIQYINEPDTMVSKAALDASLFALQYIKPQTQEICEYAIDNYLSNPDKYQHSGLQLIAYMYPRFQTLDKCVDLIHADPNQLCGTIKQTLEMCEAAVSQQPGLLRIAQHQTPQMCIDAIDKNPFAFEYVKDKTPEMMSHAIQSCAQHGSVGYLHSIQETYPLLYADCSMDYTSLDEALNDLHEELHDTSNIEL